MAITTTANRPPVPNLAALEVLVRAEKRLTGHIAQHGITAETLAITATYERMFAAALDPVVVVDDTMALVEVVAA